MSKTATKSKPIETNDTVVEEQQRQMMRRDERHYLYSMLARQLEYYFSTKNLSRDTYVQTLRSLNDGCVPVSILAGFGKVGNITAALTINLRNARSDGNVDDDDVDVDVESDDLTAIAMQIVRVAATKYSTLLGVFQIDTETGKQIDTGRQHGQERNGVAKNKEEGDHSTTTFVAKNEGSSDSSSANDGVPDKRKEPTPPRPWRWAVGPVSGLPISMDKIESIGQPLSPIAVAVSVSEAPLAAAAAPNAIKSVHSVTDSINDTATSVAGTTTASSSSADVANTIILRDVPKEDSNEDVIRGLFKDLYDIKDEVCPTIIEARPDLHDCWFVTFGTISRDHMVEIMLKLKMKTFPTSGIRVQARIKYNATLSPNVDRYVHENGDNIVSSTGKMLYASHIAPDSLAVNHGSVKNNKRNKKRSSNNRGRGSKRGNKDQERRTSIHAETGPENFNEGDRSQSLKLASKTKNQDRKGESSISTGTVSPPIVLEPQKSPSLGEDDFPVLPSSNTTAKTVIRVERPLTLGKNEDDDLLLCNLDGEFVADDDDDVQSNGMVRYGAFSDSASTATTSSSSSQSKQSSSCPVSVTNSLEGGVNGRCKTSTTNTSRIGICSSRVPAPIGCYAAALLKKGTSVPAKSLNVKHHSSKKAVTRTQSETSKDGSTVPNTSTGIGSNVQPTNSETAKLTETCWGGTRSGAKFSFADILRKEKS